MQVWCLHNPSRYAFVATEGPVVLFEFPTCEHLASKVDVVDEVRPARSWLHLMAGPEVKAVAEVWAGEIASLVAEFGCGNPRLAVDRLDWVAQFALSNRGISAIDGQQVVETARARKTPEELRAIRDAIGACEIAISAMRESLEPGLQERELWSVLHQQNITLGVQLPILG